MSVLGVNSSEANRLSGSRNTVPLSRIIINCKSFGKGIAGDQLHNHAISLFESVAGGTVFFDEIADASLQTQAKLLRVLNEGYFKRIGSAKNIEVDVRIIAATNKELPRLIEEKRFRQDLIFRLNTISIHLPPLRDRPGDILLLANHFLKRHSR